MGKREKNLEAAKSPHDGEGEKEQQLKPTKSTIVLSSGSDDEEANEDLSLKIVEKSMVRACTVQRRVALSKASINSVSVAAIDLSSSLQAPEVVAPDSKSTKKSSKAKSTKNKKVEKQEQVEKPKETVKVADEENMPETSKAAESNELGETNAVEISDNIVLRKLLRGPRYFDPPDSGWGSCYNCNEEGHIMANCILAKRKKPCFVCGSLEHHAKHCTKGQDCFICKKAGHHAKDCPEKYMRVSESSKICLKCGDFGHDMFSCKNDYSYDDLKEIQCCVCKSFGHLCCADFTDTVPGELSCYRCGQLGHNGLECKRAHGERTTMGSLGSCFKCGEGGHFARECTSSTKFHKRNFESSTPTQKIFDKSRDHVRARSVCSDPGKSHRRSKAQYEAVTTTPSNLKRRGGWITEDPGDLSHGNAKMRGWGSSSLTTSQSKWNKNKNYYSCTGGDDSCSHSSRKTQNLYFEASASNGSSKFYHQRYLASRFDNPSSDGLRRNYDW